jgi:drug/metabolite transporter (DMT)-like permease
VSLTRDQGRNVYGREIREFRVTFKRVLGISLVGAGVVLAALFPDLEFFWFKGQPLGFLLLIVGAFELVESLRSPRRKADR